MIAAIRDDQRCDSTYDEFMNAIWLAGVLTYDIDLAARICTYLGADPHIDAYLIQALAGAVLAGAVLLRDRLAEAHDTEGTTLALVTVDALHRVRDALALPRPTGLATMLPRSAAPPLRGFSSTAR